MKYDGIAELADGFFRLVRNSFVKRKINNEVVEVPVVKYSLGKYLTWDAANVQLELSGKEI